MITQDYLKECLYYNEYSGEFVWRKRPESHFKNIKIASNINGKMSGAKAGHARKTGYIFIAIDGHLYQAANLAWLYIHGERPNGVIDHIDRNPKNNSIVNLRDVSNTENMKNKSKAKNNKSGFTGVYWSSGAKKWAACVGSNGEKMHLGYFDKKTEAMKARKQANRKHNFHPTHGIEYGK